MSRLSSFQKYCCQGYLLLKSLVKVIWFSSLGRNIFFSIVLLSIMHIWFPIVLLSRLSVFQRSCCQDSILSCLQVLLSMLSCFQVLLPKATWFSKVLLSMGVESPILSGFDSSIFAVAFWFSSHAFKAIRLSDEHIWT